MSLLSHTGRVSFTEPNIQNVPKDFEIQMPTLIEESQPSQCGASKTWYVLVVYCFDMIPYCYVKCVS